jgi:hypothetical protein
MKNKIIENIIFNPVNEGYPNHWPSIEFSDFMTHTRPKKLLTKGALSAKTAKSVNALGDNYSFFILYLAPADLVEGVNVCPAASKGCKKACLFTAGRGKMSNVEAGRVNRTKYLRDEPDVFLWQLVSEIDTAIETAKRQGKKAVFRLNGTSDINWPKLLTGFFGKRFYSDRKDAVFYEYTKRVDLIHWAKLNNAHTHYTFSKSESNNKLVRSVNTFLPDTNIAVVFQKHLPKQYLGRLVIDGEKTDARFLDQPGTVVGLVAKGDAKKDESGFTVLQGEPEKIEKSA